MLLYLVLSAAKHSLVCLPVRWISVNRRWENRTWGEETKRGPLLCCKYRGISTSSSQGFPLLISFFFFFLILFIYLWLCWVFVSVRGLSLVAASGGHSSSRCAGLSLSRPLLLRSAGSVTVAHGPSCSTACGILPDQGSNPCPLHWQADSQPLRRQGSPPC